jgi:hypothetical protein
LNTGLNTYVFMLLPQTLNICYPLQQDEVDFSSEQQVVAGSGAQQAVVVSGGQQTKGFSPSD